MSRLNSAQTQEKPKKGFFRSNPVMNRLNKLEYDTTSDGKAAAYGRITAKTAYFLLTTIVGIMLYLVLNNTLFAAQPQTLQFTYRGFQVSTSMMAILVAAGVGIVAIVAQLVAAFARGTIPVSGTIYCVAQGFLISFTVFTLIKGYEYLGMLALGITIVVVLSMAILYTTGVVKVTKKFRLVVTTLFAAMIGISILTFICYLIPLTRPIVSMIMGNFWISLGMTILSIIIASLFLISDFATIDHVVENHMPAKYEWMAAFGLAFTVLWIYVKILDLLIQIVGRGKSSS